MDKVEKYLNEDWGNRYTAHHKIAKKLKKLADNVESITTDSPWEQKDMDIFFANVDKFIKDISKKTKPLEKSWNLYLEKQSKDLGWELSKDRKI